MMPKTLGHIVMRRERVHLLRRGPAAHMRRAPTAAPVGCCMLDRSASEDVAHAPTPRGQLRRADHPCQRGVDADSLANAWVVGGETGAGSGLPCLRWVRDGQPHPVAGSPCCSVSCPCRADCWRCLMKDSTAQLRIILAAVVLLT
jgi:hypothetical protein